MTDFHSHILPAIDDGSQSVEESIELLKMLKAQGIDRVYATPHFYPSRDNPDRFLSRRERAYQKLKRAMQDGDYPEILLGAEVAYFPGISKIKNLQDFRLEGSKILLLEMPVSEWSEYTLRELTEISCLGDTTVLIAHAERYAHYQKKVAMSRLLDMGIIMQSNASYILNTKTRRKAMKLIKKNTMHLIGSDCHNTSDRAPRIGEAYELIKKKLGDDAIKHFDELYNSLLIK